MGLLVSTKGIIPTRGSQERELLHYFCGHTGLCVSVQFSSVTQSYLTLCDPMDCSMLGLPVHHQLPEFVCLDMMKSFSALFHQGHEVTLLDDC